jgi:hypothetical protein
MAMNDQSMSINALRDIYSMAVNTFQPSVAGRHASRVNKCVTVRLWAFGVSCKKQTGRQGTKLLQLQSIRLSAAYHTQLLDKTSIW